MNVVRLTEDDVRNIPDSAYTLVSQNEDCRYWEARVELPNGLMGTIRKTEYLHSDELLEINAAARNESSNHRYTAGYGSDKGGNMPLVHTASIPPNVYYREIAPRAAEGDKDHLRWFLRQEENKKYLVTEGQTRK
jgi:hypothetical protein